jgi:hypothetical protein
MSPIREFVIDCVNKKKESLKDRVEFLAIRYFIIDHNNKIDSSDDDSILDRSEIKYSFTFIKVRYSPMYKLYLSWLSPIIVTDDLKVYEEMIEFNNWFCYFHGQSLGTQPNPLSYKIVDRYNKELVRGCFTVELPSPFMSFEKAYNLCIAIGECSTQESVQFVIDSFKKHDPITKDGLIDILMAEVSQLRIELDEKNQILDLYKNRFDSIRDIFNLENKS